MVLGVMDAIFWLVVFVFSLPWFSLHFGTPLQYRYVPCTGALWKRSFPSRKTERIRSFLLCFTNAMAFPDKDKLRFKPSDKVLDVYRSIYGGSVPSLDALECETFLENLSHQFEYDLDLLYKRWHEHITLAELYEAVDA